jgi:multiple antibiotic resistance protein
MSLFFLAFTALFSVMNPLGTIPVFVGLTSDHDSLEIRPIVLKTSLTVLFILLISFFLGDYILLFFGISIPALKIGGGLIIASSGFSLLSGEFRKHKGMKNKFVKADVAQREDIAITPLALPMIAGPGTISLLISYKQEVSTVTEQLTILAAVIAVSLLVYVVLRTAHPISNKLGASGINALSRIIGFIVITIGVEFIISAVETLIPNLLS